MATLPGQRAQFTWALNEFNKSEDPAVRDKFVKAMARIISAAPEHGFTPDQVTQKQSYPESAVAAALAEGPGDGGPSEEQAQEHIRESVDTSEAIRIGEGTGYVYAYGYRSCPGRLKVGSTEVDAVQRIAAQIGTSTPDKPTLFIEIRTNACRSVERAIQNILEARGRKVLGGGDEWFATAPDEVYSIYEFIRAGSLSVPD